jgi:hypothetical protein
VSFSDERAQLHPALYRIGIGEPYAYAVDQWAHDRDQLRIEREPWPFAWTVPSPQYHPHQENPQTSGAFVAWRHPLHPRNPARRIRRSVDAQLAQYVHPELTILDECTAGGASTIGTTLHATFERYRLGEWP